MDLHSFDKITAIKPEDWGILEKYAFFMNYFYDYHKSQEFRDTIKQCNQFSTYNLASTYYDSTAKDVLLDVIGTTVIYHTTQSVNSDQETVTEKVFDDVDMPDSYSDLEHAVVFRIASDRNSDLFYTPTDVKVLASLLIKNQNKMDHMPNKRVQAYCQFIIEAAKNGCALFGWKKILTSAPKKK